MRYLFATLNFLILLLIWVTVFAVPSTGLFLILYITTITESNQYFNRVLGELIARLDRIFNLFTTGHPEICVFGVLSHRASLGNDVALVMIYVVDKIFMRQEGYCCKLTPSRQYHYRLPF